MKLHKIKEITSGLVLLGLLQGCTTTAKIMDMVTPTPEYDYSSLYLRGSFSWWEADEKYKVVKVNDSKYSVMVDLVADGQPYDFKFSDKDWTPGLRCGYLDKTNDEILSVGVGVDANCDTPVDNFKFTPDSSGTYLFTIEFHNWNAPEVTITKI